MLEQFLRFIHDEQLVAAGDRVLLAVSGGMDSVVMCELFHRAGIPFGIAHCNFQLRGDESDGDELFARQLAASYGVEIHVAHFDTGEYARREKLSVQEAARMLRYDHFSSVKNEKGYSSIATAHHRNDEVETFFINLVRGTGLAGLQGIRAKHGDIIRPLLFASRSEIETFANANKLQWREDSSNSSTKYLRNKIRHDIIPAFRAINPSIEEILHSDIRRVRGMLLIVEQQVEEKRKLVMSTQKGNVLLSIDALEQLRPLGTYLFLLLSEYGFSEPVVNDIIRSLHASPGKTFYSPTHRLVKDRSHLIVSRINNADQGEVMIGMEQRKLNTPVQMEFDLIEKDSIASLKTLATVAYLDKSKLRFPLLLRKWRQGDHFVPLGMGTRKKLSDFFIDSKLSVADKEKVWVLVSGDDIVWIAGYRPDDRYKVTDSTSEVFVCKLIE